MNHLKQLVEYITGMDTRVGYPSEHLAGNTQEAVSSPLFATSVGLLMNALEKVPVVNKTEDAPVETSSTQIEKDNKATVDISKQRKSILDRFGEKLKEFLDNA